MTAPVTPQKFSWASLAAKVPTPEEKKAQEAAELQKKQQLELAHAATLVEKEAQAILAWAKAAWSESHPHGGPTYAEKSTGGTAKAVSYAVCMRAGQLWCAQGPGCSFRAPRRKGATHMYSGEWVGNLEYFPPGKATRYADLHIWVLAATVPT